MWYYETSPVLSLNRLAGASTAATLVHKNVRISYGHFMLLCGTSSLTCFKALSIHALACRPGVAAKTDLNAKGSEPGAGSMRLSS